MNMLHDVSFGNAEEINVVVENCKGSSNKIEYDKDDAAFKLDRVFYSAVFWPFDYGFIPQTWHDDDDPVDVVLLTTHKTFPGCIVVARPIALLLMEDEKGKDDKVIAVPVDDPRFAVFKDINDIPAHTKKEIKQFFETYKSLEPNKWVKVKDWENADKAKAAINAAVEAYKKKFKK
jgi:inorganic pyrophosphatase